MALAEAGGQSAPILRIGFPDGGAVRVGSDRPFKILTPDGGPELFEQRRRGDVSIVVDGAPEEAPGRVYRIQAGSFQSEASAESEAARLLSPIL